jgi:similar to stage IV sporulation protein
VQIIENKAPPTPPSHKPANLVAAVDGQIESVELLRGNCMVSVGQAVRAGELLVSGIYDSNTVGYRYTRAAGRILARTERTVTVNIPLHYDQKESGDPKIDQTDLNFFGFSIKIFKSTGNLPIGYDIIYKNIELDLPFVSSLPIGWRVTYAVPYEIRAEERTPTEALELAYAALERELAAVSGDVMLLSKEICTEIGEDGVVLTCTLRCIEDIARQIEFEITE